MKYISYLIVLSVLALQSCTDNLMYSDLTNDNEAKVTGNTYKTAFTENSSVETFSALASGSQILLNASGSLEIDNETLTYMDNQWKADKEFEWNEEVASTDITALYPVYADLSYSQENLYSQNQLEDVLYVKESYPTGSPIRLQFNHLFARLTLHLDERLQTSFKKISVTGPAISSVVPASAEIIWADHETHTTTLTQASSSGNYFFIVPPAEDMTLTINLEANGKNYTALLEAKSFNSNQEYTYQLKTSEKTPGIVTAEDWIAFSQLINNQYDTVYNKKTLADFGETINGVTTYYLLNDIDFTGVKCTDLEQIGHTVTDQYFSDTFDGQGHTLYHIPIKTYQGSTGVFGATDKTGIIKNLHIASSNVEITSNSKSSRDGTGILVGCNYGKILSCSIKDCQITANPKELKQSGNTGGIAGSATGEIINCSATNLCINYDSGSPIEAMPAGGIVGSTKSLVVNCYSANNIINHRKSYNGGICGEASAGAHIENCYVYNLDLIASKGAIVGKAANSTISYNYYDTTVSTPIGPDNKGNQLSNNIRYTSSFTNQAGIPIYQLLNQWINETAPTQYPGFIFTPWTDGGQMLPAQFAF